MNDFLNNQDKVQALSEITDLLVQFLRASDDRYRADVMQSIQDLLSSLGHTTNVKLSLDTARQSYAVSDNSIRYTATDDGQRLLGKFSSVINDKQLKGSNKLKDLVDWYHVYHTQENYLSQVDKPLEEVSKIPLADDLNAYRQPASSTQDPSSSDQARNTINLDMNKSHDTSGKTTLDKTILDRYSDAFIEYALNQGITDLRRFGPTAALARLFVEPANEISEFAPMILYIAMALIAFYYGFATLGVMLTVFSITEFFELNDSYHDELLANLAVCFQSAAGVYGSLRAKQVPSLTDLYNLVSSAYVAADVIAGHEQSSRTAQTENDTQW